MQKKIINIINRDFPEDKKEIVIEYLSTIKLSHVMGESEINLENTLLSILFLAKGDVNGVAELTACAKKDFRDVIYWATLEAAKETFDEVAWGKLAEFYKNIDSPRKNTEELLLKLGNDIQLVRVIEGIVGESALEWIERKIPALNYGKPVNYVKNKKKSNKLKKLLMNMAIEN